MIDLTNVADLKKLDSKKVLDSTGMFAKQCEQIWANAKSIVFPNSYKSVKNIVICGMGGSSYGGHVALSLLKDTLSVPLVVQNNYYPPAFVNEDSLVILTSFSGSTEETLSCGKLAKERGAKITGLTSGGKLKEFLKINNAPSLVFDPKFNPSGQPRLGTGYIVLGTLALLTRAELLSLSDEEVSKAIKHVEEEEEHSKTTSIELAKKLHGSIPVVFAAEFLEGNIHIIRNQFNETAKSFSAFSEIPELNHHLMEGLKNPQDKKLTVLFITSSLYPEIIKKRITLTKDVVEKNNIPYLEFEAKGNDKLSQVLYTLSFGGYLTLYLAFLYRQDPSVIPWVDYFKKQLAA